MGFPFVMFYNAAGVNPKNNIKAERIGIALSNDMIHWHRYVNNPVIDHNEGITGDGVIQKIDDVYVMFYFGAFWKNVNMEHLIHLPAHMIWSIGQNGKGKI